MPAEYNDGNGTKDKSDFQTAADDRVHVSVHVKHFRLSGRENSILDTVVNCLTQYD